MLLELALKQLKLTKKQFQIKQYKELNLSRVTFVGEVETPTQKTFPDENTKLFAKEHIYASETHMIKTTKYGRIKSIEEKPKAKSTKTRISTKDITPKKPIVTIKPHRKIVK
jgi:hypothetical protein